jgi:hypothetical protein
MKTRLVKRGLLGFAVLFPLLSGCNPALQWREPPRASHTKLVCEVRGMSRSCVRLTDAEFHGVARQLQLAH